MFRTLLNGMLACTAVMAVTALAYADETVIEKHSVESQHEVVAPPVERRVEERTVTQEPAVVKKRTDTVVTHERDNDNDDNDND